MTDQRLPAWHMLMVMKNISNNIDNEYDDSGGGDDDVNDSLFKKKKKLSKNCMVFHNGLTIFSY